MNELVYFTKEKQQHLHKHKAIFCQELAPKNRWGIKVKVFPVAQQKKLKNKNKKRKKQNQTTTQQK